MNLSLVCMQLLLLSFDAVVFILDETLYNQSLPTPVHAMSDFIHPCHILHAPAPVIV